MEICGPEIVVMVVVLVIGVISIVVRIGVIIIVVMTMVMVIMTVIIYTQNENAGPIHQQAKHSNHNGLVEHNFDRVEQPQNAFKRHKDSKNRQQHRASKTTQSIHLAGAEAVLTITRISSRIRVCKSGDAQGYGMGSHVQPISQ